MKIVKHRHFRTTHSYYIFLEHKDNPGAGYQFDCDKNGVVRIGQREIYLKASLNPKLINRGVKEQERTEVEPAEGICECGGKVCLSSFTNECWCGLQYDVAGYQLAPRKFWYGREY